MKGVRSDSGVQKGVKGVALLEMANKNIEVSCMGGGWASTDNFFVRSTVYS